MEHQIHFKKKFYLDKKKGYWISTTEPRIRAHVWVWKYYNGEIPKGYHIHHIDHNKSNNKIENLKMICASSHLSLHMLEEDSKKRSRENAEKIRPLTKIWHASKEGIEWHKKHGREVWENRKPFNIICKECNKSSLTKTFHQEFCSNACKSKWRRKSKIDHTDKTCPICLKKYISCKYSRAKTCGKICGKLFKSKVS